MMHFKCANCDKDIYTEQLVGTVPPNYPLVTFCSDQCLDEMHEKIKNNTQNDN